MLHEPHLSEKSWERIKASVLTAVAVGAVRVLYGVTKDVLTEAIKRSLWPDDEPDDDDEDEDGDA